MKRLSALFVLFLIFSGCAETAMGPTNKNEAESVLKKSINGENILLWSQACWIPDEFGFEQFHQYVNMRFGILALTEKGMIFMAWDMEDEKYIPLMETDYEHIKEVKKSTWGAQARLSILTTPLRWHAFSLFKEKYSDGLADKERMLQAEKILKEKIHNTQEL